MRGDALNVRSHLTFLADAAGRCRRPGRSRCRSCWATRSSSCPTSRWPARPADPRVGFFTVEYTRVRGRPRHRAGQARR
ncbi:MAG: hypothetical protein MZV63_27075 [Marinilabiliales bacterium]|nr:hypothetical protein [Marinilabiliales bacterium]